MQTSALAQNASNPSNRVLLPLDGGISITNGIPAFDPEQAMHAFAGADNVVRTVSPAPERAPMFEAPKFDQSILDDIDLDESLDPGFVPAPRPRGI